MNHFEIDFTSITKNVNKFQLSLRELRSSSISMSNNLSRINYVWEDFNTKYYLDSLREDRDKINAYFEKFNELLSIFNVLNKALRVAIDKSLNVSTIRKITYSKTSLSEAEGIFNTIKNNIDSISNIIKPSDIPMDCPYSYYLNSLIDSSVETRISNIDARLGILSRNIDSVFAENKTLVESLKIYNLDNELIDINYKSFES